MDKLRHIHSKVGTETAFRITIAVEDAIAEAVEAYDLIRMAAEAEAKRGDELAARCNRLQAMAFDLGAKIESQNARNFELPQSYRDIVRAAFELIREPIGASLLLHDAALLESFYVQEDDRGADHGPGWFIWPQRLLDESAKLRKQAEDLG
jgi:hypothetical protein